MARKYFSGSDVQLGLYVFDNGQPASLVSATITVTNPQGTAVVDADAAPVAGHLVEYTILGANTAILGAYVAAFTIIISPNFNYVYKVFFEVS